MVIWQVRPYSTNFDTSTNFKTKKAMEKFKTRIIKIHGKTAEPNLQEINELGLKWWRLEEVRKQCQENATVYTYSKPKWWVLF